MNWIKLTNSADLNSIKKESQNELIMIFKQSTRCSISAMVLNRLERSWSQEELSNVRPYYLDLLQNRELSNQIANEFDVLHQSPQVLMLRNGEVVYHDSHMNISYDSIKEVVKN